MPGRSVFFLRTGHGRGEGTRGRDLHPPVHAQALGPFRRQRGHEENGKPCSVRTKISVPSDDDMLGKVHVTPERRAAHPGAHNGCEVRVRYVLLHHLQSCYVKCPLYYILAPLSNFSARRQQHIFVLDGVGVPVSTLTPCTKHEFMSGFRFRSRTWKW